MILLNKLLLGICILILIPLVSCNTNPDQTPDSTLTPDTPPHLDTPTKEANQQWVILTEEQAEGLNGATGVSASWSPATDDILKLEEELAEYLEQNSTYFYHQPPVWERLDEYHRQYMGIERNGRRIIYGNFFCDNFGWDWLTKFVFAIDGGECYFQVEYDVEDCEFIKLRVNGES